MKIATNDDIIVRVGTYCPESEKKYNPLNLLAGAPNPMEDTATILRD